MNVAIAVLCDPRILSGNHQAVPLVEGVALMAHIERFGSYVILALSPREKFFGFHSSPQARYDEIVSVRKIAKPWSWKIMRGLRAPGTGIPGVVALGTWRVRRGKNFLVVYGKKPAYTITFSSGDFNQWIITPDNSEEEMRAMFKLDEKA